MKRLVLASVLGAMLSGCGNTDKEIAKGEYSVATWRDNAKCAVSFTFDDGCANQLTTGIPLFAKYDKCATFYLVKDWVGDWTPWKEAAAAGHEIACHTVTHPNLYELSEQEVREQLVECQKAIDANVEQQHMPTIAYPYCATPQNTKLVSDSFIAGRICDGRIEPATPADFVRISSFGVGSESQFKSCDSLIPLFEKTRSEGGWCTLLYHELDGGPGYSPFPSVELDKTLAYLTNDGNNSGYWVAPFAEVARYILRRNATTVEEISTTSDSFSFKVKTLPAVYDDEVITIERNLPEGWTKCTMQNTQSGTCDIVGDKIVMSIVAVDSEVTVVVKGVL